MFKIKRLQKHKSIRKKISGSSARPRVSVFRSSQHIYAQVIDDTKGLTLAYESDLKIKTGNKREKALKVGEALASKIKAQKLETIVFDRGGFNYHGRIASVAEGLRKGGVKF